MRIVLLIVLAAVLWTPGSFAQKSARRSMPAIQGMTRIDSILFTREYFAGLKARTLGQEDLAFEHFSRCTDLNPRSDAAWSELAILHYKRGEREQALTLLNRAIAIQDKHNRYLGFNNRKLSA